MLPVYLISWRNYPICKASLESFIRTASEPLEISVAVPNDTLPDSGTDKIHEYLTGMVEKGLIKRALFYETNCFGFGLVNMIKDFPPDPETQPLMVLSDMDLLLPDVDWCALTRKYHEDHWVVTGCNLSTKNYKEPNWGFSPLDDNFGLWLHCHKTEWFNKYHGTERNSIDSDIMTLARGTGGATKIREIEALHLAWEIHYPTSFYYDPVYAQFKREHGSNWVYNAKPDNMSYKLVEK